ncbi:MAG TPA: DJ-1/PfpI family protein [Gammaproteobacteria bacterium]|nr:DJ-1/PfpI family protein [Gammaproteobacteria bacterium]
MNQKKTLGILLFPDFELLDMAGPLEMFGNLLDKLNIVIITEKLKVVPSAQNVSITADVDINHSPDLHYLLIPGGMGVRTEVNNQKLIHWIEQVSKNTELNLTVCTGAALLAKTGLLDSKSATTNKIAFDWVVAERPQVNWIRHARWVVDDKMISSSGVAAGIDMSLYVIGRLFGLETSEKLSKKTEYIWNKDPSNDPFA